MKPDYFYETVTSIIEPFHDNPERWISENDDKLRGLNTDHKIPAATILNMLKLCVGAGKLRFFFEDFARWKNKAESIIQPTADSYPITREIAEKIKLTDAEQEEADRLLDELVKKYLPRRKKEEARVEQTS